MAERNKTMTVEKMLEDIKSGRRKKVILDTDTYNEIDDQYALAYCYLADSIDLLSVNAAPFYNGNSTSFEDGMLKSYNEIKKVLSLLDPNYTTPVFEGSRTTIEVSGALVDSPAARNIIETVKNSDEPVYVLGIGAITNVASALLMDPSIKDNMGVIWLGANPVGAQMPDFKTVDEFVNNANLGEFNLVQDYTAGQYLINSGVPLLLCPAWGIVSALTSNVQWTNDLKGKNPVCDYLWEITDKVMREWMLGNNTDNENAWVRTIWDIAAPAILDVPECAEIEIITAPIFTDWRTWAYDSTRHKMLYLKKIDREIVYNTTWPILKGEAK